MFVMNFVVSDMLQYGEHDESRHFTSEWKLTWIIDLRIAFAFSLFSARLAASVVSTTNARGTSPPRVSLPGQYRDGESRVLIRTVIVRNAYDTGIGNIWVIKQAPFKLGRRHLEPLDLHDFLHG